jgi:hypothetical protein
MSFENAQYYISERKEFVCYEEFVGKDLYNNLSADDMKQAMVQEGE